MASTRLPTDVIAGAASEPEPPADLAAAGRSPRRPIPPKFYRIGDLVDYSGVSRQTIHNYTTMGLLRESRWTPGGHRLYSESVFERLDRIAQFKAARKTMAYIRSFFAGLDSADAGQQGAHPTGNTNEAAPS